jgi:hypothetical protein
MMQTSAQTRVPTRVRAQSDKVSVQQKITHRHAVLGAATAKVASAQQDADIHNKD